MTDSELDEMDLAIRKKKASQRVEIDDEDQGPKTQVNLQLEPSRDKNEVTNFKNDLTEIPKEKINPQQENPMPKAKQFIEEEVITNTNLQMKSILNFF